MRPIERPERVGGKRADEVASEKASILSAVSGSSGRLLGQEHEGGDDAREEDRRGCWRVTQRQVSSPTRTGRLSAGRAAGWVVVADAGRAHAVCSPVGNFLATGHRGHRRNFLVGAGSSCVGKRDAGRGSVGGRADICRGNCGSARRWVARGRGLACGLVTVQPTPLRSCANSRGRSPCLPVVPAPS